MSNLMTPDSILDATGLQCPMPLLKTKLALRELTSGQILKVIATDSGSQQDIPRYLEKTNHRLLSHTNESRGEFTFMIVCGE
ncbi:sulfurtransferase TusA family protein [Thalassolituus sp.]|jgi:TusA-related sulfurtransferase|uniref:sulfurtransferase TusA family protein n=1 Tax=Thalassolituus sp. TaxID=2030822 RepID=UPI002E893B91|nr:sulfurtransferase TusA family protein [Pseudomonadota bacterium]MEC8102694.1 sulfurtransferase TusA family protein [Pseudomonadota bacterium]MEC8523321.1 sulfurtransferase TusA family protein [Pseudomonadota bacterium]MEE2749028.1 sulfurtransferase TusA family protein [Pseudomonadota bacterium]|tara:strand:+ start:200 stop:445 length:246 start_codon:yes stop_codon:yes gene_type:complete